MHTITEVEDAILATLQEDADVSSLVRKFMAIPSLDEVELEKLVVQFPTIGILSSEGTYEYGVNQYQEQAGTFSVLVFNRNLRSTTAALRGEAGETGIWDVVEVIRAALVDSNLGLTEVTWCFPVSRSLLFAGDTFACASLDIEVKWHVWGIA